MARGFYFDRGVCSRKPSRSFKIPRNLEWLYATLASRLYVPGKLRSPGGSVDALLRRGSIVDNLPTHPYLVGILGYDEFFAIARKG